MCVTEGTPSEYEAYVNSFATCEDCDYYEECSADGDEIEGEVEEGKEYGYCSKYDEYVESSSHDCFDTLLD